MSNKWKRIGQDAWVEMSKPSGSTRFNFPKVNDTYNNRTHHPIENPDSWWKDGEVKGEGEFNLRCSGIWIEGQSCNKNNLCTFPDCTTLVAIPLKPQPMSERKWETHYVNTAKPDLRTLKLIKEMFGFHSDSSAMCNGYRSLCSIIDEMEK